MRKGFSLTEILTTIVILAVLAAIAIPGFSKSKGKNDARQAITYLRTIRLAEKMHYAKNGSYVVSPPAGCTVAEMASMVNATKINACLGTEITDGTYVFSVAAAATTFTATATGANTISLNQAGPPFTCTGAMPANFPCPTI